MMVRTRSKGGGGRGARSCSEEGEDWQAGVEGAADRSVKRRCFRIKTVDSDAKIILFCGIRPCMRVSLWVPRQWSCAIPESLPKGIFVYDPTFRGPSGPPLPRSSLPSSGLIKVSHSSLTHRTFDDTIAINAPASVRHPSQAPTDAALSNGPAEAAAPALFNQSPLEHLLGKDNASSCF